MTGCHWRRFPSRFDQYQDEALLERSLGEDRVPFLEAAQSAPDFSGSCFHAGHDKLPSNGASEPDSKNSGAKD